MPAASSLLQAPQLKGVIASKAPVLVAELAGGYMRKCGKIYFLFGLRLKKNLTKSQDLIKFIVFYRQLESFL